MVLIEVNLILHYIHGTQSFFKHQAVKYPLALKYVMQAIQNFLTEDISSFILIFKFKKSSVHRNLNLFYKIKIFWFTHIFIKFCLSSAFPCYLYLWKYVVKQVVCKYISSDYFLFLEWWRQLRKEGNGFHHRSFFRLTFLCRECFNVLRDMQL